MKKSIFNTGRTLVAALACLTLISFQNCANNKDASTSESQQSSLSQVLSSNTPLTQSEEDPGVLQRNLNYPFYVESNGATTNKKVLGTTRMYKSGLITINSKLYNNNVLMSSEPLKEYTMNFRVYGKINTTRFAATEDKPFGRADSIYKWLKFLDSNAKCLASGNTSPLSKTIPNIPLDSPTFDTEPLTYYTVTLHCYTADPELKIDLSYAFESIEERSFSFRIAESNDYLWAGASDIPYAFAFQWQK